LQVADRTSACRRRQ